DSAASDGGAVYVFKRDVSDWRIYQKLTASDVSTGLYFGQSVAISGSRIVVGGQGDGPTLGSAGAVYVFELSGGAWIQTQKLKASDKASGDMLGMSVALDGDVLVAGARNWEDTVNNSGAAYVYRHNGTAWV